MKIRVSKNLYVDSKTLFRFEWRKWYPAIVIHEKFEKYLKWTLRAIAVIGIATSVISISQWYISLGVALLIFLVEQFFEKTAIEYTTMVVQPPPTFEIEYNQWKTNGFMIPREKNTHDLPYFGPSYLNEEYATKFFGYLRSWINNDSNDDKENNLVVSLVIEPNEEYTTYIYANLGRKRLDSMFKFLGDITKLEKYGKRQQQFIAQMFYWNTLDYKDGYYIKQFLDLHNENDPYYFTPSVIQPFGLPPKFLFDCSIKKYHLKVKKRKDLKKGDPEYIFDPASKKVRSLPRTESKPGTQKNIINEIEIALNNPEDVGFMPNHGKSVGIVNLCYSDCTVPFEAYRHLISEVDGKEVLMDIKDSSDFIDLTFTLTSNNEQIRLSGLSHDKEDLQTFIEVNGGGQKIALVVGYPPANERKIVLEKDMSPIVVTWKYEKKPAANST